MASPQPKKMDSHRAERAASRLLEDLLAEEGLDADGAFASYRPGDTSAAIKRVSRTDEFNWMAVCHRRGLTAGIPCDCFANTLCRTKCKSW